MFNKYVICLTLSAIAFAAPQSDLTDSEIEGLSAFLSIPEMELIREERAARRKQRTVNKDAPMCNKDIENINRLAGFAGHLLIDNTKTKRGTRAAIGASVVKQNPGRFCKQVYARLQRLQLDVLVIEKELAGIIGNSKISMLKKTLRQLKESLQEQMNIHNVKFVDSGMKSKVMKARSQLRRKGDKSAVKDRAERQLDSIIEKLETVGQGCQRWKRSIEAKQA